MPGRIDLDVALGAAGKSRGERRSPDARLRILVLGDLGGRAQRRLDDVDHLTSRPVHRLDLERFDAVFAALAPALELPAPDAAGQNLPLAFSSLDDFHPDRLCRQVPSLRQLAASRERLRDPATFDAEAARLTADPRMSIPISPDVPAAPPSSSGSLLEQLIGGPAAMPSAAGPKPDSIVDALIRRAVAASDALPGSARSPAPYLAALEATMAETLRMVLHHPDVQALESAWRGLRRFVEGVDLDEGTVELHILDVTRSELLADAAAHAGNVGESGLLNCLRRRGAALDDARRPWSLMVAHFEFGADPLDVALLAHLGAVASQVEAPILASAHPTLAGATDGAQLVEPGRALPPVNGDVQRLWTALRRSPVAPWIGLALPRLLLRQPYGAKSDAIDTFAFEEAGPGTRHDDFLWGSSALACAQSIAGSFVTEGPDSMPLGAFDIDDLPTVVRDHHGERTLLPCAEFRLPTQAGEALRERGFIAVLSYANRNAVRVPAMTSIAEPSQRLAGLG